MNKDEAREADARYGKLNHEYFDGWDVGWDAGFDAGYDSRDAEVERLQNPWIPVSERLPGISSAEYLATFEHDGKRDVAEMVYFAGDGELSWFDAIFEFDRVVAWMPLPEPYKAALGEEVTPNEK